MNIPGFTAEASLYGKSGHYRMAGAHTHAEGAIQPAGRCPPIGPLIRAALSARAVRYLGGLFGRMPPRSTS